MTGYKPFSDKTSICGRIYESFLFNIIFFIAVVVSAAIVPPPLGISEAAAKVDGHFLVSV